MNVLTTVRISNTDFEKTSFNGNPELAMMIAQTLLLKNIDSQMREKSREIKFIGNIKKNYQNQIIQIQNFLLQNPSASRKDGKRYVNLTVHEMANLMSQIREYKYDAKNLKNEVMPLKIPTGDKRFDFGQGVDELHTEHLTQYFEKVGGMNFTDQISVLKKFGNDASGLPFYFGHTGNRAADGTPVLAVFTDGIDQFVEQLRSRLQNVEMDSEILADDLSRLSGQRKTIFENLSSARHTLDALRSEVLRPN